jgi:hypothetical protein
MALRDAVGVRLYTRNGNAPLALGLSILRAVAR